MKCTSSRSSIFCGGVASYAALQMRCSSSFLGLTPSPSMACSIEGYRAPVESVEGRAPPVKPLPEVNLPRNDASLAAPFIPAHVIDAAGLRKVVYTLWAVVAASTAALAVLVAASTFSMNDVSGSLGGFLRASISAAARARSNLIFSILYASRSACSSRAVCTGSTRRVSDVLGPLSGTSSSSSKSSNQSSTSPMVYTSETTGSTRVYPNQSRPSRLLPLTGFYLGLRSLSQQRAARGRRRSYTLFTGTGKQMR